MSERNITTSTSNLLTLLSNPKMRRPLSPHRPSLNQDIRTTSMSFYRDHIICLNVIRAEDFVRKYMWPNSCLPSATALITAAHTSSQGRFTLERVENHAARQCYF